MEVNKMKRNPPQNLLEDGITIACYGVTSFLTYKYLYPLLKEENAPPEEAKYPDALYQWPTYFFCGIFALGGGAFLSEVVKDRYL